jgi:hypothetical protein
MSMWLYQFEQNEWTPELFRRDIWEGEPWHFRCGQIRCGNNQVSSRGQEAPKLGEVVFFFFARTDCSDPGIYGWGVIDRIEKARQDGDGGRVLELEDRLYFIPSAPTNHLKMDPWWDDEARGITDEIRGGLTTATLFQARGATGVPEDMIRRIRDGIKRWLSPGR